MVERCGGLRLASTDEEVNWLKYVYGISRLAGRHRFPDRA
jgi:hypothetical protein